MTREEAIAILKDISWQMGSVKRWENIEAIDMAIEALSAEPCKSAEQNVADVPIDDLVSRADVLALINKAMFSIDNRGMQDYIFNGLRRKVHNLPSADVVSREDYYNLLMASNDIDRALREYQAKEEADADRQKGEWKWTHGGQCSECGFHNTNFDFNFCPHCGADMKGVKY